MKTLDAYPAETTRPNAAGHAGKVVGQLAELPPHSEASYLTEYQLADEVYVPNIFDKKNNSGVMLPSLEVKTPLGHEARLVNMMGMHPKLEELYSNAVHARKADGMERRLGDMCDDALIRMLDTSGASGLHHIHGSIFPHTVYFNAKRGNGILASVYLSQLARMPSTGTPVIGFVTATRDKRSEYELFRLIGAGNQKGKRTP